MSNAKPNVWRLTLECGHLRLDGPWDQKTPRHLIGDITWCEVCPRVHREMALRQVVNVENVPSDLFREPDDELVKARRVQFDGRPRTGRAEFF